MSGGRGEVAARADFCVLALVASAGGLDAVSRVLGVLPAGFSAAVIVLIHQQPDRIHHLEEILRRSCRLPVIHAENGTALRQSHVVVAPSGKHVLITPELSTVLIASGAAPPSRPSADLLLTTLAIAAGAKAIAVVLSGQGHDGATGATAIDAFGGTVVASDQASSTWFSMPSATIERDGVIDHVAALDELGDLLVSLVQPRAVDPGRM